MIIFNILFDDIKKYIKKLQKIIYIYYIMKINSRKKRIRKKYDILTKNGGGRSYNQIKKSKLLRKKNIKTKKYNMKGGAVEENVICLK